VGKTITRSLPHLLPFQNHITFNSPPLSPTQGKFIVIISVSYPLKAHKAVMKSSETATPQSTKRLQIQGNPKNKV